MQEKKLIFVNFAERFRDLVDRNGQSQKDLAAILGISEGAIVNYKRDRIPKAEELLSISRHFGVTIEWLLTGEGPQPPGQAKDSGNLRELKAEAQKLLRQLEAVEETAAKLRGFLG